MKALEYLERYSFISLAFLHQFFKIFWNKKYFEKEVFFSMQKFSLYVGLNDNILMYLDQDKPFIKIRIIEKN